MLSNKKLQQFFREPSNHANDLIQDQLERMEVMFDSHCENNDPGKALAIYQEYKEWIDADDGDKYGFMLLEFIGE